MIDGPGTVTMGETAAYDVFVDFQDEPYPADDIESVSYLLFDAEGQLSESGDATVVEDGTWQVELTEETTAALGEGSNRLEVIVVSKLVALPSLATYSFVTTP